MLTSNAAWQFQERADNLTTKAITYDEQLKMKRIPNKKQYYSQISLFVCSDENELLDFIFMSRE